MLPAIEESDGGSFDTSTEIAVFELPEVLNKQADANRGTSKWTMRAITVQSSLLHSVAGALLRRLFLWVSIFHWYFCQTVLTLKLIRDLASDRGRGDVQGGLRFCSLQYFLHVHNTK